MDLGWPLFLSKWWLAQVTTHYAKRVMKNSSNYRMWRYHASVIYTGRSALKTVGVLRGLQPEHDEICRWVGPNAITHRSAFFNHKGLEGVGSTPRHTPVRAAFSFAPNITESKKSRLAIRPISESS